MVKSLVEELQALIQSEANNYPPPQMCSVTRVYEDKHVDVKTNNDVLVYVELLGADVEKGDSCLLVFLNEDYNEYVAISSNGSNSSGGGGVVMIGSFHINDDGHLIATIPSETVNPYHINENGHLIYDTEAV